MASVLPSPFHHYLRVAVQHLLAANRDCGDWLRDILRERGMADDQPDGEECAEKGLNGPGWRHADTHGLGKGCRCAARDQRLATGQD